MTKPTAERQSTENDVPKSEPLIEHLNDTPWWEAPIPRRWHRCRAQTFGWVRLLYVERCACGALGSGGPAAVWIDKNSRRREARR